MLAFAKTMARLPSAWHGVRNHNEAMHGLPANFLQAMQVATRSTLRPAGATAISARFLRQRSHATAACHIPSHVTAAPQLRGTRFQHLTGSRWTASDGHVDRTGSRLRAISQADCCLPYQFARHFTQMAALQTFLFTSESVNEGHPDKLADQISDAVLDACLEQDPSSKVACETCTKTNMVMVFGEITTKAKVDYEAIVRKTCKEIGFISDEVGLDGDKCKVLVHIEEQSPDIGQSVHGMDTKALEDVGAGDQGHMFGYATDETPELMPLTHVLATQLGYKLTEVRKNGVCPWLRPDGKTQVTVEYKRDPTCPGALLPQRVHTILISTQHSPDVTNDKIRADLMEHVIKPVVPAKYLDDQTIFHLNPSGRFVIGGPHGDAGLTGRKIIIDTYGGWGAHGGGAFSGKDPTKVDRSAAYLCRQVAKSIVASGLARRCLFQVSYAIGVPDPLSLYVDSYGTGTKSDAEILEIVKQSFKFRPGMIAKNLDLMRGGNKRYQKTAAYGHFGRDDADFTWEKVVKLA